jgi:hypothetical protein
MPGDAAQQVTQMLEQILLIWKKKTKWCSDEYTQKMKKLRANIDV